MNISSAAQRLVWLKVSEFSFIGGVQSWLLQGMILLYGAAMVIMGFLKSSSFQPLARKLDRAQDIFT